MTNFDFLKADTQFASFADIAASAEYLLHIDRDACVLNCRRAMEFAIKWMYEADEELTPPRQSTLVALMNGEEFREIVGEDVWQRMDFIRRMGNCAAHDGKSVTEEQAALCLENLFCFFDALAYFYSDNYTKPSFDPSLLELTEEEALSFVTELPPPAAALPNGAAAVLTARRAAQQPGFAPAQLADAEDRTRRIYIDFMLQDAGWIEGRDWLRGVKLPSLAGMPSDVAADMVLYGADGSPLAVVETTRSASDWEAGRQQAALCAEILAAQSGRRPAIFCTNGFETHIIEESGADRRVSGIYSRRDLEKRLALRASAANEANAEINASIADRAYQQSAVAAARDALRRGRRRILLTMAAGSGKTRIAIALYDVLLRGGAIRNALFLADRAVLVTQAARAFSRHLPALSAANLCEDGGDCAASCVLATYDELMDRIDGARDAQGKIFTPGHFDLVICDEAHRALYNRYRDLINYFDAPLIGLTATPAEEIDAATYEIFAPEDRSPVFAYTKEQAIRDGYLVDYESVATTPSFSRSGAAYDELSATEKERYEKTFVCDSGALPPRFLSDEFLRWVSGEETVSAALDFFLAHALRVGARLGKTILFAQNGAHARRILEILTRRFPALSDASAVIDPDRTDAQAAIDEFSSPESSLTLAISVDELDTGVDVPQVLNLVFLRRVVSKAKFWQMIGRGARPCPGLLEGRDKTGYRIFDFCGNFDFFRLRRDVPTAPARTPQGELFWMRCRLTAALEGSGEAARQALRRALIAELSSQVAALPREHFAVRQHLASVNRFADAAHWEALGEEDLRALAEEVAPLWTEEEAPPAFDLFMTEAALDAQRGGDQSERLRILREALMRRVGAPSAGPYAAWSRRILYTDELLTAGPEAWEEARRALGALWRGGRETWPSAVE